MTQFKLPLALPGMNFREVGLQNELAVLRTIGDQGWVRELELAILTGFGVEKTELISRRLARKGLVFREKIGNSGIFLRLRKEGADQVNCRSGKDVEIPKSWRHDSVAIQALNFLSCTLLDSPRKILSEAKLRKSEVAKGKIPDGALEGEALFFEQEWTRKSGKHLMNQTKNLIKLARQGIPSVVAYPFPPQICGGVDFETRNSNAIRDQWGGGPSPIKFLRCIFFSFQEQHNAKVSEFDLIELPQFGRSKGNGTRLGQVGQFGWIDSQIDEEGVMFSELRQNGQHLFTVKFTDGRGEDDHSYCLEDDDELFYGPITMNFMEFILRSKRDIIRQQITGERDY